MRYSVLIISALFLFACENEKTATSETIKVILAGKIENYSKGDILVQNWGQRILLELNEHGEFNTNLEIEGAEYLTFSHSRFRMQFFCEPGDSIYINYDIEGKDKSKHLQFSGDKALENNYLTQKLQSNSGSPKERQSDFIKEIKISDDSFLEELNRDKQSLDNELLALDNNLVNTNFIKYEEFSNKAEIVKKIVSRLTKKRQIFIPMFKNIYDPKGEISITEVDTLTSDELTNFVKDLDINNRELYTINKSHYVSSLQNAVSFFSPDYSLEVLKDEFAKMDVNYYNSKNQKIELFVKDSVVLEGYYYQLINSSISWNKIGIAKLLLAKISNDKWLDEIEARIMVKEEARKGQVVDFPEFQASRPTDEVFTKSHLLGKYTYIDFWATWCGPCKREIPSLKKLEKEYHDKNINFVSISIDSEKDYDKWKKMVKDLELTGIQLHVSAKNYNPIKDLLKINSIPRFVLLGPDGKTLHNDAPRPSSLGIRPLLNSLEEI